MVSLSDQNERDVQPPNVTTACTENHLIHSESLLGYTENHLINSESQLGYTTACTGNHLIHSESLLGYNLQRTPDPL